MNIRLFRAASANDPHYAEAMALYAQSFPYHEQREPDSQAQIMHHPAYHFDMIVDGEHLAGVILNWQTDAFIYVEHLCIMPGLRGQGYGRAALDALAGLGKTVILEIDPPVDDISIRRSHFYEKAGYVKNPYPHVHPPYHEGHHGHDLVIMSYPDAISAQQYEAFYDYLCRVVMHNAW